MESSYGAGWIRPAAALAASFFWLAAAASAVGSAQTRLAELSASTPLRFEQNAGQVKEEGVRFFARGSGYRLALGSEEAVFSLGGAKPAETKVRLRLAGGAKHPVLKGIDPLPTKSNYFLGSDPRAWRTGIPTYAAVEVPSVYPGIDVDIPSGECPTTPERVREAVDAAFRGGAKGVILSRKYSEMRLVNLYAVKDAIPA